MTTHFNRQLVKNLTVMVNAHLVLPTEQVEVQLTPDEEQAIATLIERGADEQLAHGEEAANALVDNGFKEWQVKVLTRIAPSLASDWEFYYGN